LLTIDPASIYKCLKRGVVIIITSEVNMMSFYSVAAGRTRGCVYTNWGMCSDAVGDYPGAVFRKWEHIHEATQHLNRFGFINDNIIVYTTDGELTLEDFCTQFCLGPVPDDVPYIPCMTFDLRGGLCIEVCKYADGVYLDIYQKDWETGQRSKKWIALNIQQWDTVKTLAPHAEECMIKLLDGEPIHMKEPLGSNIFLSVDTPYKVFNIRLWEQRRGKGLRPTTTGVTLRSCEWERLMNIKHFIDRACAEKAKNCAEVTFRE
jgi:hypothetical protein